MTTTALNGQKQLMKADKGDKYQVELLSTADVYKAPSAEEAVNTDFAAIFSSQQVRNFHTFNTCIIIYGKKPHISRGIFFFQLPVNDIVLFTLISAKGSTINSGFYK